MSDNPIRGAIWGNDYPEAPEYKDKWTTRTPAFETALGNARQANHLDDLDLGALAENQNQLNALSDDMNIFAHQDVTKQQRGRMDCSDLCAVCGELNGKAIFIDRAKSFKGKLGAIVNVSYFGGQPIISGLLECPRVGFSIVGASVRVQQQYENWGSYGLKKLRNANKDERYIKKTPEKYIQLAKEVLGSGNNGTKTPVNLDVKLDYQAIAHCEHLRRRYFDMRHARECVSHSELCGVGSKALVFACTGDALTRSSVLGALKDIVGRQSARRI